VSDPHEALMALARDLVEEISMGRAVELAAGAAMAADMVPKMPPPPPKGAQAVHPALGGHLAGLPGDTISGHAYAHLGLAQPGRQAGPPIAGP
jgi:hypothetical protein